tara:strand:- start:447 stop:1322 length:876 start_codon:yes stop_codon:yes gene_type:complete
MADVDTINGVDAADIDTINGVDAADIDTIYGVDLVTTVAFANTYVLKQTTANWTGSVTIANPDQYHFRSGGSDSAFSISVWVYGSSSPPKRFRIATKGSISKHEWRLTTGDPPWYAASDPPPIQFTLYGNDGGSQLIQWYGNEFPISGSWHHIVATYDGSEASSGLEVYLDGTLMTPGSRTDTSYSGLNDSGEALVFGELPGNSDFFKGYMDEVSIWSKELTAANVTDIYNHGTPTNITDSGSLKSWWRMGEDDSGTGTTVTDVKGVGNGTLSGFEGNDGFVLSSSVPHFS